MGMNIGRGMEFRQGVSNQDLLSANREPQKSDDSHVDQMRQKIGTDFTGDSKRSTGKKKNELGKDDFMKLMSAQLKYQDPVNPMKNEQMAAQLAQFSALEQMMNVNSNLEKMASGQKPSEHMMAASLIGKRVTTDTSHFMLEKGATPEITFNLPSDANSVNVAVVNAKGEVVREFDLGEMQRGPQSVRWDGKNAKFQDQPVGEYSYRLVASDGNGKAIPIKNDSSGIVSGVTFEAGKSVLLVDGKKVPIESVGRIEADVSASPSAKPLTTDKQKLSTDSSQESGNSTQATKNSLPSEFSAEKIKSILASAGASQGSEVSEAGERGSEDVKSVDPLWNPATN